MKINYQKGQYELAEKWGNAMFYPMFDSLPADNRAKAERYALYLSVSLLKDFFAGKHGY